MRESLPAPHCVALLYYLIIKKYRQLHIVHIRTFYHMDAIKRTVTSFMYYKSFHIDALSFL